MILTGSGRSFVAGADIGAMRDFDVLPGRDFTMYGQRLMDYVEHLRQPVIAAVNGFALGGGCELAMACDIRVASEKAKFGQPEVNLGIIPGFGGTQRLPRLVGKGMAKYLIMTGEHISAQEALRIGMVQKVVPPEALMGEAERIAQLILSKAPVAILMAKCAINTAQDTDMSSGIAYEAEAYTTCFQASDRVEGMSAFLVDRSTPGVTVSPDIPRMGIRAASNAAVTYQDVRVPAANLLGGIEGTGFKIAMKTLDGGRIGIAAQAVGIAQGAIDEAVRYVKERVQFGRPIAAFQNTQFKLAEMQTMVDAARLMTYRAAVAKDQGQSYSTYAAMAKLLASDVANQVTRGCVQLLGGYGYAREYVVERMMRDAKITEIYEGTSEVMKMVISGSMRLK